MNGGDNGTLDLAKLLQNGQGMLPHQLTYVIFPARERPTRSWIEEFIPR